MSVFWFKHTKDFGQSKSASYIIANGGLEAYGAFMLFLEVLISRDNEFINEELYIRQLGSILGFKHYKKTIFFLKLLINSGEILEENQGKILKSLTLIEAKKNHDAIVLRAKKGGEALQSLKSPPASASLPGPCDTLLANKSKSQSKSYKKEIENKIKEQEKDFEPDQEVDSEYLEEESARQKEMKEFYEENKEF